MAFDSKIEHTFKQAVNHIGALAYHLWMQKMKRRRQNGNQYLHREPLDYHNDIQRKINVYHAQLGQADRIEACLAIDRVVAWRIYYLNKLGREVPQAPCTVYFEEAEWKALMAFTTNNPVALTQPPTLREAIRRVASLGGFLGRKSDGEPGTQTLWIGLQRLDDIVTLWRVMTDATHTTVSSRIDTG